MRYLLLIFLFFTPVPVFAKNAAAPHAALKDKGVLIRDIKIEGFVLGDKGQFIKMFKPYRNKYLTAADLDKILEEIQIVYEREGYQQLVLITYKVIKHRVVFTASMTS